MNGAASIGQPFRWMRIPVVNGDVLVTQEGRTIALEIEVGTAEAARMLRCSIRHVQAMCDEGRLEEGRDWRRLVGARARGGYVYRIKLSAVRRLMEE